MTERSCRYLVALTLLCLCIVPILAEASDDYWSPWVTKTSTDSATINWRGEDDGSGSVDYATSSYFDAQHSFEKTIATTNTATYQHVQLTGLEPNTRYVYRVRPSGRDEPFDTRTFRTMPESGPFTFIVISDPQRGHHYDETVRFEHVAEAVEKEPDIQFILVGGDFNGFDGESDWDQFFQVADGMLSKSSIFPTIGNHEYHNPSGESNPPTSADHYHWAFDMPLNYSFDCSGVRFIVLNTPDPENHGSGDDPKTSLALAKSQESWLRKQLDDSTLSGVFTIHHHPIWDHDNTSMNPHLEPWESLYHTYNISANFAGHIHNYQRFLIGGIPYFIVGNAGGRCNDITGDTAPVGYKFGIDKTLGYLKVTVDPANNTATAQELIVATVKHDDSNEVPEVYKTPKMIDSTTFPLRH